MTSIQTLVRASAEIVRIQNFEKGNVYLRLEKPSYSTTYNRYFGIVTNIAFNGEAAMITTLEWNPEDATTPPVVKVFGEESNAQMFPADPAEVESLIGEMERSIDSSLDYALDSEQKRLDEKVSKYRQAKQSLGLIREGELTAAITTGVVLEEAIDA